MTELKKWTKKKTAAVEIAPSCDSFKIARKFLHGRYAYGRDDGIFQDVVAKAVDERWRLGVWGC